MQLAVLHRSIIVALAVSAVASSLAGCTTAGFPLTGGTQPIGPQNLTGNWVFNTTATSSANPFTLLAGFINEPNQGEDQTTVALQVAPSTTSGCYLGADTVPFVGTVTTSKAATPSSTLAMRSFQVNGQAISVNGTTTNPQASLLTGTYSVAGGCANGSTGTLTGTRYNTVNGTYAGNAGSAGIQLTLTQNTTGTGSGNFSFSTGAAAFTGISCFTTGTLGLVNGSGTTASTIIGNAVSLNFQTDDATSAQVNLTGTIDQAAKTLTISSASINNGACAGSLGTGTLTLQ